MNKDCKHEWHPINPFQKICCNCNLVLNVVQMKNCSQKEFAELYPNLQREVGEIVFDTAPDFTK